MARGSVSAQNERRRRFGAEADTQEAARRILGPVRAMWGRARRPSTPVTSVGYLRVVPLAPQGRPFPCFGPDGGIEPSTAANLGKVTVLEIQWGNMKSIEALHQLLGDSVLGSVWNRTRGTARPLWAKGATILVPGVDPRLLIPAAVEMIGLRHIVVYEGHQHHVCRALNRGWPAFGRCVHGNRRLAGMKKVD